LFEKSQLVYIKPPGAKATDHYVDDIIVNTEAVGVEKVVAHLTNFGLITKAPEKIDDAKVLDLKVS